MKHIPNLFTSFNLLMGCLSVIALASGQVELLFYFLPIALVFDFLDGMTARVLKAYSEIGKQLDSLADLVSFGLVPALVFYYLLAGSLQQWSWWALPAFIYTIAAALRLAKFNIDKRQSEEFLGLATPAAALFVLGLLYMRQFPEQSWFSFPFNYISIYTSIILLSAVLLIEIPMFSFKIKSWQWVGNEIKFIFAFVAAVLLLLGHFASLPIIILLYVILSVGKWLFMNEVV